MKLNIQLFATNTINRKANGYSSTTAYQFRVTVTETGNISGNTREVNIVYDVKATNPGGYEYMKKPYAYVYIDGTQEKSKQILDIWPRGEWITLFSFKKYLEAGTTHTIRGRYNSNDTTSYMPLKGNVDCDVSISLLGIASVLNSISLENTYGTFSYNKKNASFYDVITFTSNGKTFATINNPKTTIGDYTGTVNYDMSQVLAAATSAGSKTINVDVSLKTYTDNTKTTQVGNTSISTQAITLGSSTNFDTSQNISNNGTATLTPTFTKWNAGTVCDLTISGGTYSQTFTNVVSGTAKTLNNSAIFTAMGTNTSLNINVKLTTKSSSNGAILGEIQLSKTLTLPNYSINITSSFTDLNNSVEVGGHPLSYYKPNTNTMIKGLSNPRITYAVSSSTGYLYGRNITTSGAKSQTISTGSSTNVVVEPGTNMNASYTLIASDGRKSNSSTESFTLANYFNPSISPIEITRPDGPTAPKFYVSVNGTFFNGTNLTNLSNAELLVQWSNDNNTWNTLGTVNDTDGSISYSTTYTSGDTDFYKKPVYIKATLTDRIGNQTTLTNNIPPGQPVFNTYKDSDGNNYMRVNGDLNIENDLSVNGTLNLYDSVNQQFVSIEVEVVDTW